MRSRRHKYNATPTIVDGVRFDSKAEARRWNELRLLERAGEISDLGRQIRFPLLVKGKRIGFYVADFQYRETVTGKWIVEDVKGMKTDLYRWKKKHFAIQYGVEIREVQARGR